MSSEILSINPEDNYQIAPGGEGFIYSVGNSGEWNEQRGLDMQFIGAFMKIVEKYPERFTGEAIHDIVSSLPTFQRDSF